MIGLIVLCLILMVLCLIIYAAAYFSLKASGQPMEVKPIKSFDDYFTQSNGEIR
ncbi:hypothetical protein SAMN04487895_10130 [Paenibacillus sophorae]|uniref:Uncharacterized protein n=1 Tax=Paenibacillus sophorae TaxID=1333845 RepID=A0A1H8F999_9BACL|nr:hypothetical protein [Paenibacillus sophorae]QWU13799.1 hypothetical protein KP014_17725 [Paenibacillus sophorae]SEN28125.1 hypothetical protein SAMN04487895_10130 [Paenibacillus sophorae]